MKSRSKSLKYNAVTSLLSELVTLIIGLILPRLILLNYGSTTNGLVSSISQFLSFSVILRAGVGAVTRVALFKPLAEKNDKGISEIMAATGSYMRKIALILGFAILIFSFIYPLIVLDEYAWWYAFLMVLILGIHVFTENFFGIKYMILLQADQKWYIQTFSYVISQVLSFVVAVVLIKFKSDMLLVKLGCAIAFLSRIIFLHLYVKKHYNLDNKVKPNHSAIKQRWSAFFHQVAAIINNNIDIVLITIFAVLSEVSVYTVHFMVANNIGKIVQAPVSGLSSTFGDMIARNEKDNLRSSFSFMQWAMFAFSTALFAITAILITPFVDIYTHSIIDVNYHQPLFGFMLVLACWFNCLRIPYQSVVEAKGHFRQTRNGAFLEAILNIIISVTLLIYLGLIGVVIGTLVACVIRTVQYSWYAMKKILGVSILHVIKNYIVYVIAFLLCLIVYNLLPFTTPINYSHWIVVALIVAVICIFIVSVFSMIFNRKDVAYLINRVKGKIKRKV